METEVIQTTRKGKSILFFFFPYFELFRRIDAFPIQTLIITELRNVMLTVTRELGLPVVLFITFIIMTCCQIVRFHCVLSIQKEVLRWISLVYRIFIESEVTSMHATMSVLQLFLPTCQHFPTSNFPRLRRMPRKNVAANTPPKALIFSLSLGIYTINFAICGSA